MTAAKMPQNSKEEIAKRPNYFAGQYLLEDDFKSEQKYHIDRQRRHNRLLHVSGIAEGLTVSKYQDLTVKVSAGTAFDSQGRQIILLVEKNVELVQDAKNKNPIQDGNYTLLIRYSEELTDKQGEEEITNRRVQEKPVFVLSSTEKPDDSISLAKLAIKGNNVTIDPNVRQYSGIYLPTEDGKGVTLRSQGEKNTNLAILEGSLRISGKLEITEDCEMKKNLKVEGGLLTVHSLQIGKATESPSVNRIVNKIIVGTEENANDKALPTVKAAIEYADNKAMKNGDSKEDFAAAQLTVTQLSINNKAVTQIKEEINETLPDDTMTIPTTNAVKSFVDKRKPLLIKLYERKGADHGEFVVSWNERSNNFVVPITMLLKPTIRIKTPRWSGKGSRTLMRVDENQPRVTIAESEDGWECTMSKSEVIARIMSWKSDFEEKMYNLLRIRELEGYGATTHIKILIQRKGLELIEKEEYEEEGWSVVRRVSIIDVIIRHIKQKEKDLIKENDIIDLKNVRDERIIFLDAGIVVQYEIRGSSKEHETRIEEKEFGSLIESAVKQINQKEEIEIKEPIWSALLIVTN
jgi:hypothetical protein